MASPHPGRGRQVAPSLVIGLGAAAAFVYAGWCENPECEAQIKEETKATIRVLPDEEFRSAEVPDKCLKCGRPATVEAVWAKAY